MEVENRTKSKNLMRASTARVEISQLYAKMRELETNLMRRSSIHIGSNNETFKALVEAADDVEDDEGGNKEPFINQPIQQNTDNKFCEYDLTTHVLQYLPTPLINHPDIGQNDPSVTTETIGASKSSRTILKSKSKYLGMKGVTPKSSITETTTDEDLDMDPEFDSMFLPTEMRLLALVSHNNMKSSMKQFVKANKNVLKKFRLTGTNTTMTMLKEVFGDDPDVMYGPACKSGPLGGDAQLVAMAVTSQLGGCIFFIDPMDAHPHSADIECLVRQGNVHNILMMNNPTTAHISLNSLRVALKMGRMEMFPSFFFDLESPSVAAYQLRQEAVLESKMEKRSSLVKVVHEKTKALSKSILKSSASSPLSAREKKIEEAIQKANLLELQYRSSLVDQGKPVGFHSNLADNKAMDSEEFPHSVGFDEDASTVDKEGEKGTKKKWKRLFLMLKKQ